MTHTHKLHGFDVVRFMQIPLLIFLFQELLWRTEPEEPSSTLWTAHLHYTGKSCLFRKPNSIPCWSFFYSKYKDYLISPIDFQFICTILLNKWTIARWAYHNKDFTTYFWFLQCIPLIPIRQSHYWSTWTLRNALWSNLRLSVLLFSYQVFCCLPTEQLLFVFLNVMNIQLLVSMPTRVLTCLWKL